MVKATEKSVDQAKLIQAAKNDKWWRDKGSLAYADFAQFVTGTETIFVNLATLALAGTHLLAYYHIPD